MVAQKFGIGAPKFGIWHLIFEIFENKYAEFSLLWLSKVTRPTAFWSQWQCPLINIYMSNWWTGPLNNMLAFQMPGTFILAWRPILLNIVRNGVFSEAGLQIPIKIPAIDKFTQMNYSKTQYIAIKWSLVHFFTVYIMANSLPSTEYWAVRHRSQYSTRQCTVSRVFLLLPPNLSRGKGGATRSLVGRQRVARVSYPRLAS